MRFPARSPRSNAKTICIDDIPVEDVVESTRIRLARNINGLKFPNWCQDGELADIFTSLSKTVVDAAKAIGRDLFVERLSVFENITAAKALSEINLISKELFDKPPECAGFAEDFENSGCDNYFSVMINEEDHLRIQYFTSQYDLRGAWEASDALDTEIGKRVEYAFNRKLGYLTACPSNLGTGMRASVMLAVPGLVITNEFDATCRAIDRLGFNARGCNGEGTAMSSYKIQISNRGTLGMSEQQVLADLADVVDEVILQERKSRLYAMRKAPEKLNDFVARGLATAQSARLINTEDAANALFSIEFGIGLGMVAGMTFLDSSRLASMIGHSSLRVKMRAESFRTEDIDNPDIRDAYRARLMRMATKKAKFKPWPDEVWE